MLASLAVLILVSLPAAAQQTVRFPAKGQVPAGYPAQYATIVAAAEREGNLVIHSTTDLAIAAPVIDDFQALYPRIEVQYQDMNSTDLYNTYLSDVLTSPTTADVVWSSAMELQFRIVDAGQAEPYDSPEAAKLPGWAIWKNLAFGTTYEPIVIAYNRRQLAPDEVPQSHADLTRLLTEKRGRFAGKVATYDVERSGLGFLLAAQDQRASEQYWPLAAALGAAGARTVATTEAILAGVGSGGDLIGYNALGSYANRDAKPESAVGIVFPQDYTLVVTRVMFVGKKAVNPNAAKLWVDYLLSPRGQKALADRAGLAPIRTDVESANSATAIAATLGARARPIAVGPDLIGPFAEPAKRLAFLRQWKEAMGVKR